jgi:hypothetical protein
MALLLLLRRDPFDRLLIAQAMTEPATLYTADQQLLPIQISSGGSARRIKVGAMCPAAHSGATEMPTALAAANRRSS